MQQKSIFMSKETMVYPADSGKMILKGNPMNNKENKI